MATEDPAATGERYVLNPFALPDETVGRYRLMVLAALILSFTAATAIRWLVAPEAVLPSKSLTAPTVALRDPVFLQAHQAYALSLIGNVLHQVWPGVVGMLAVWWLAGVIAARYPEWLRRQQSAQPLDASLPAVAGVVTLLRQATAVARVPLPALEQCGTLASQHAQVFGSDRAPVLLLGRGLQLQARRDPTLTLAVLQHELAHVVNGDVGRTYATWSLFLATSVVALLPLAVAILGHIVLRLASALGTGAWERFWAANLPVGSLVLLQGCGAALVLVLALAGFLRARETYADWRAATWGQHGTLLTILERNAGDAAAARVWWRPALHPTPAERIAALREPMRLFGVGNGVAFLTGVLGGLALPPLALLAAQAGLALSAVMTLATAVLAGTRDGVGVGFITAWLGQLALVGGAFAPLVVVAYLISATWGLEVQRSAAAAAASRDPIGGYRALAMPALLMTVGVQFGLVLLPVQPVSPVSLYLLQGPLAVNPLTVVPWSAVASVAFWACLAVTRYWSLRFLGGHLSARPPVRTRRLLTITLALLLAPQLLALVAGQFLASLSPSGPGTVLGATFTGPLLLVGFMLIATLVAVAGFLVCWMCSLFAAKPSATCGTCGSVLPAPAGVHTTCAGCGMPAARWLFVTTASPQRDTL